jgi:hypothetical protein
VRLLAGGDNKKALLQGKVFIALKSIFTQPCFPAPKAYIVVCKTIAQKNTTAKIQNKNLRCNLHRINILQRCRIKMKYLIIK